MWLDISSIFFQEKNGIQKSYILKRNGLDCHLVKYKCMGQNIILIYLHIYLYMHIDDNDQT